MDNNLEIDHIQRCLALAEARFDRGANSEWTTYDFEKLSDSIHEVTGVTLSVTTLKRLWGKLSYTNTPAITTLNALARYAGFEDWSVFKHRTATGRVSSADPEETKVTVPTTVEPSAPLGQEVSSPMSDSSIPTQQQRATGSREKLNRKWPYWALGLLSLGIVLYVTLLSNGRSKPAAGPSAYQFSSNKTVLAGVPNSVIFRYDASAAGNDSVFISQSWDVSRKFAVPADKREYSSIYYYPGYFRAKLLVGKQIVKEHDLFINSNGWLALIEQHEVPVYFTKKEFLKENTVTIDKATLEAYNIPLQPTIPQLRFFNVQDFGNLRTDNFSFETSVKSNFNQGSAVCQRVEVLILCKNDVFIIPLCAKGCVGDLYIMARGKYLQSKDTDLSKLGRDLSQWVQLKVEAKDQRIRILVDGEEACAFPAVNAPTDIVGLQYRFEGPGAVKDTRFINGNSVVNL